MYFGCAFFSFQNKKERYKMSVYVHKSVLALDLNLAEKLVLSYLLSNDGLYKEVRHLKK